MRLPRILFVLALAAVALIRVQGYHRSGSFVNEFVNELNTRHAALHTLEPSSKHVVREPGPSSEQTNHTDEPATKAESTSESGDSLSDMVKPGLDLISKVVEGQLDHENGQSVAGVMGIKLNSEEDQWRLPYVILLVITLLATTVAVFTALRGWFPMIYAQRVLECEYTDGDQPASEDGAFGWFHAACSVSDDDVVDAAGLDALMFLEFCRLFMRLMLYISPLVLGLLCPMHYYFGKYLDPAKADFLGLLSIGTMVGEDGSLLQHGTLVQTTLLKLYPYRWWVHAAMVWVVVALALCLVSRSHQLFLTQRFKWLAKIPEPRSTTLMVECIPPECRSDSKLKAYFAHLFTDDAVERAYMVRKTGKLQTKVAQLGAAQYALTIAERQWEKDGKDPKKAPTISSFSGSLMGDKGENAIQVHSACVQNLKAEASEERARIEDAVASDDPSVVSTSGFVTFKSRRWCRLASREQYRDDTSQWVVGMPPDPTDVVYNDLVKNENAQTRGNTIAFFLVVGVFVIWTPLVTLTSSLTSLTKLQLVFPWLQRFCSSHPVVNSLLEGVLATLALKLLMSFLPSILMLIIRQFLTLKSGAWAQLKLQNRYFMFQVTFVIFILTIGISVQQTLKELLDRPSHFLTLLAQQLPKAANFYLNYVLLGCFTLAIELLRPGQLASYFYYTRFRRHDSEAARKLSEPEDQDSCGMGARFAKVSLIMTLAVVFSTVMPLIPFFAAIYFYLCSVFYAYLFVYAESKKPDLGGQFWIVSLQHIFFALTLYVALIVGILTSQGAAGRYPAAATAPVVLVMFLFWRRLGEYQWEILPFETLADMDKEFTCVPISSGAEAVVYIQPECCETNKDF